MTQKDAQEICQGPEGQGCGQPATVYCVLMTRTIARCDKHKDAFISTVFEQIPIRATKDENIE